MGGHSRSSSSATVSPRLAASMRFLFRKARHWRSLAVSSMFACYFLKHPIDDADVEMHILVKTGAEAVDGIHQQTTLVNAMKSALTRY